MTLTATDGRTASTSAYRRVPLPRRRPTQTTSPTKMSGRVAALTSTVRVGYAALSGWSALRMRAWPESSTRWRAPLSFPVNGCSLIAKIRPAGGRRRRVTYAIEASASKAFA